MVSLQPIHDLTCFSRFDITQRKVIFDESLRTWIKTIVNKFAISNHTALILAVHALRSYLKLICEYGLHIMPNKKVSGAKDHGENYIKVRPPPVLHLLRNRLQIKCPAKTCILQILSFQIGVSVGSESW